MNVVGGVSRPELLEDSALAGEEVGKAALEAMTGVGTGRARVGGAGADTEVGGGEVVAPGRLLAGGVGDGTLGNANGT